MTSGIYTPADDGGSAFPREDYQTNPGPGQSGMSLRDYFAAQALTTQEYRPYDSTRDAHEVEADGIARRVYRIADAMLKARKP